MKPVLIAILLFCSTANSIFAQQNTEAKLTTKYDGGDILLRYQLPAFDGIDSVSLAIYRTGANGIETLLKQKPKVAINSKFIYSDTTIRKKPGIYQYRLQIGANQTALLSEKVWAYAFAPDEIPVVISFNAKNTKETKNINLSWKIESNYVLSAINLQRSRKQDGAFEQVATLNQYDSTYVDKVTDANEPYFYRLAMENMVNGKIYYSAITQVIPQFAIIPLAPNSVKVQQIRNKIMVSWENIDNNANGFYIMKRAAIQDTFLLASAKIFKNNTNKYQWADSTGTLINNEMYQYTIVSESNSFNRSKPSDTATIAYTKNTISLSPPQNLQIVTTNDTIYNLVWQTDSLRQNEVAGYAVFVKNVNGTTFTALANGVVTADINYISIPKPSNGDTYRVIAVNGTKQSTPSIAYTYNNAFQKEFGPKYLKAAVIDHTLNIKWLKPENVAVKMYRLYKWNGKTFGLIETIQSDKEIIATKSYIAGELNIYQLKTINAAGIESNGSKVLQVN